MAKLPSGALDKICQLVPQVGILAQKLQPSLQELEPLLQKLYPYWKLLHERSIQLYEILKPYYDQDTAEILVALVLLLFGGHFAFTIAAWQAFRVSGSRLMSKSWHEMVDAYHESKTALEKDPEAKAVFAKSSSGTIGPAELFHGLRDIALATTDQDRSMARKKILLVMKCIDPNKILDASLGLWTGCVAVLAILRSRFVHCISLGASVGQRVFETIIPLVQPRLYEAFPQHQRWVDFGLRSSACCIGALTSLLLIRVISAFNSAFQGSAMLVAALAALVKKKGWVAETWKLTEDQSRMAVWAIALVAFAMQLKSGFNLPFLVKLPLTPVILVEWLLSIVASI